MSRLRRRQEFRLLEYEIEKDEYREALSCLQRRHSVLRPFPSWNSVVAFMHLGSFGEPQKDELVRAVLEARREDGDVRWETLLLAFYWPLLEWVHARRWRWERDEEERWANTLVAFHMSLHRVDPGNRNEPLAWQILNRAEDRLRAEYRKGQRRGRRERSLDAPTGRDPDEDPGPGPVPIPDRDRGREEVEARIDLGMDLQLLRRLWRSGRISDRYFPVLLATRIYGKSIEEYAQEAGLTYDTAKRRRLRAEAIWSRLTRKFP